MPKRWAAVDAVEAETYDLALLDLGLPLADGLALLRHFRKSYRQLPVIIVTARDVVDDRVDGLDLGADDYLTKPFEVRELLRPDAGDSSAAGQRNVSDP